MIVLLPRTSLSPSRRLQLHGARDISRKSSFTVVAGGPGSGRHPYGSKYNLPNGFKPGKVREQAFHPTWSEHPDWRKQSYGGVLVNNQGKFLLREPANHFGGYTWTFPKGTVGDAAEHPVDTALREVAEETGRKGRILEPLPGNFQGSTGNTNFYLMRSEGHDPSLMDKETWQTKWVAYPEARYLLSQSKNPIGRSRDLAILDRAHQHLKQYEVIPGITAAFNEDEPRDEHGKWTSGGGAKDAKAALLKQGFKHIGKTATPGKEGLKTGMKPTYVHPTLGKMWVGAKNTFHQTQNQFGNTVIKKVQTADVPQHVGALKLLSQPTTYNLYKTAPSEQKSTGPPQGMPQAIKGPKGGVYEWHEGNQSYTHKYNPDFQVSTDKAKLFLNKGTYTPVGKGAASTMPQKDVGVTTTPDRQKEAVTSVKSPSVSTTVIPESMNLKPDQFTYKDSGKGLGGAHDKYVYTDHNGNDWLFKPATTLGGQPSPVMGHADETVSRIAQAIRPGYAIEAKAITMPVPGKGDVFGSIQKMIPSQFLRGKEGQYKDFTGRDLNSSPLQDWEKKSLQQEQVLDWLTSNHDSHGGQFLRTTGTYVGSRSVIGIDKSQAFKYFPNDKLSVDYKPNTEQYGEKQPFYNDMWAAVKSGKAQFDPMDALPAIKAAEGISKEDYKGLLKPYADAKYGATDSAAKTTFLDQAVARKENLRADFEKFYGGLMGEPKFKFEPPYDPNNILKVNVKSGKKGESLPDSEVRPNSKDVIQSAIPSLLSKYQGTGKEHLNTSISNWQSNFYHTDPSIPEKDRYLKAAQGAGLHAELAAKVGLMPKDLQDVSQAISSWKGSTSTQGASNIRAAAQDIINDPDKPELKSRFSAALQVEHEVTKAILAKTHGANGSIPMTRKLSATVADKLKEAAKVAKQIGGVVEYHTMGAEGWSTTNGYSGQVKLSASIPVQNIIHSYEASGGLHNYSSETESFVAFPGKVMKLPHTAISGAVMKNKKKIVVDGTEDMTHHVNPIENRVKPYKGQETYINVKLTKDGMEVTSVGKRV